MKPQVTAAPIDEATVHGFGEEWRAFDQSGLSEAELRTLWESYFAGFPWERLPADAVGADIGCGSGRWAKFVAPRVRKLWCVDPSEVALEVARRALEAEPNVEFTCGAAGALPFRSDSLDFGYSLGVLHHTPDPALALRDCVRVLKPGAPFLVYLYYALDNRPPWFRMIWRASDGARKTLARTPFRVRYYVSQAVALLVYFPLARVSRLLAPRLGGKVELLPLAFYRDMPFYVMRNDALDRLGTPVEHRFTRAEVEQLMTEAGLVDVRVKPDAPYWCATGYKSGVSN